MVHKIVYIFFLLCLLLMLGLPINDVVKRWKENVDNNKKQEWYVFFMILLIVISFILYCYVLVRLVKPQSYQPVSTYDDGDGITMSNIHHSD